MSAMQTQHTKGPWKYSTNVGPTKALIVEADGATVVELSTNTRDSRFTANVRLMAAAPELLAALKAMLDAQGARRHPLGAPDEHIATQCAEAASLARSAIAKTAVRS